MVIISIKTLSLSRNAGLHHPFPIDKDHPEPMEVHAERLTPIKEAIETKAYFREHGL